MNLNEIENAERAVLTAAKKRFETDATLPKTVFTVIAALNTAHALLCGADLDEGEAVSTGVCCAEAAAAEYALAREKAVLNRAHVMAHLRERRDSAYDPVNGYEGCAGIFEG